jgi:spermidine synthase
LVSPANKTQSSARGQARVSLAARGWALPALILAYGAGTMVSQVLILRELLVLAQGQELKLALGLWCWLLWAGLGSLAGGRGRSRGAAPGASRLGGLLLLLGLLLPATLLFTRATPSLLPLPWGQSLPPGLTFSLFLALLAPFGLASGYFFPCACRVLEAAGPAAVGRVYWLETLGASLGVLVLQLLLLGRYLSLAVGLGTGLALAAAGFWLGRPLSLRGRGAGGLALLVLAASFLLHPRLEDLSRRWQWPGRQVAATVDSPYALLTATREAEQLSFFANNVWQFTYPDPMSAEHQVQVALLEHPRPERVLLLGGGAAGLVPEILKTPSVTRLDYVELDPQLVQLAQSLLPAGAWPHDPRVSLIYQDARRFLAGTPERYDVIVMNLPEPRSGQLNRFYTREFFATVARRLTRGGVFSFSLTGGETGLHPLRAAYLALAYRTLGQAFPEVLAFPGERIRFFASNATEVLTADPRDLVARLQERQLKLRYVREYYLLDDLSRSRQEYLWRLLQAQPPEVNTDLAPRCYFFDLVLSGVQEGLPLKEALLSLQGLPRSLPWGALALGTLLLVALLRRRPGPLYLYQVLVMGLGTMALEVVVLVLYQVHLGYLYRRLGLLIAAFMAGMAAGSLVGSRWARRPGERGRRLAALQLGLAALAGFLALVLPWVQGLALPEAAVQGAALLVLAAAGFGGGGVFALSAGLWARVRPGEGTRGGVLYAADLLGATVGTLAVSLLVLPVWGLLAALYLVAALHAGAGAALLVPKN